MGSIHNVRDSTRERVEDLARAWGISEDAAITRLIEYWRERDSRPAASGADEVSVHAVYRGRRYDGIYHPSTKTIDIVSGLETAKTGLKPSAATAEVIKYANPTVSPSRNGWSFWLLDQNGEILQTIRDA